MALAIDQRERESILILDLVGRLTMGPESHVFRTAVRSCVAAGKTRVILGCSRLRNIDSAGLGALVLFHAELRRAGGKVVLLEMVRTRVEPSILAKLDVVFDVFTDQQEAVNSFFPDRALKRFDILQFVQEQIGQQAAGVAGTTGDERPLSGGQNT